MFKRNEEPQKVTMGRFEMEQDGKVAYLEYSLAGKILGLIHTEVPPELRGKGLAGALAESAFQYARENELKVDVICPAVGAFVEKHPEYRELLMK
jgi:uncharacterized protein